MVFHSELDAILGEKRSINPEFLWESNDASENTGASLDGASDLEQSAADDIPSCPSAKKRKTAPDRLETKLSDMAEERKAYTKEMLEFLKKKEEREKRKEEREQIKLEILEAIAKKHC
ncbi:PREDICTED: uncharacterized protein LOC108360999 [Rhagoletis zephyria]|uniref:uncharacterized protein LOC108360999 n=1 Tax=Rhagoletis zephyria TaxID=28612 RepID=UPI000811281E|nr:PREDICTED: uncharacterized protein LOC108360999 [Rhagoletis zephyria]